MRLNGRSRVEKEQSGRGSEGNGKGKCEGSEGNGNGKCEGSEGSEGNGNVKGECGRGGNVGRYYGKVKGDEVG